MSGMNTGSLIMIGYMFHGYAHGHAPTVLMIMFWVFMAFITRHAMNSYKTFRKP